MNATQYKKYHELFMQDNHGSSAFHTFLCIFFTVQCSLICTIERNYYEQYIQCVYEYSVIVLPMILAHTLLSEHIIALNVIVLLLFILKLLKVYSYMEITQCFKSKNYSSNKTIDSITCLRALTYLITGLCILAVDFKDFPRYLAKTENYGYSLMDTGVGLFVLMSGLVHKDVTKDNYKLVLQGNMKFLSILLLLGIGRLVSIKQLDYQEHVTEYGVHWNFFFTLAICKLLSTFLLLIFKNSLILIISTISIHELLLYLGLQNWVFSNAPRTNIIDANREGISSCLGYVFLYLCAGYIKCIIKDKSVQNITTLKKLFIYTLIFITSTFIINELRPASRTLANTGYCLYLSTLLVFIISILYAIEIIFKHKNEQLTFKVPKILLAVNNNGLLYFLVSNLTTGLINMTFRTLMLSSLMTFLLLNLHMVFNLTIVVFLTK